jgi:hypothetical protein
MALGRPGNSNIGGFDIASHVLPVFLEAPSGTAGKKFRDGGNYCSD